MPKRGRLAVVLAAVAFISPRDQAQTRSNPPAAAELQQLRELVLKLQARVDELEKKQGGTAVAPTTQSAPTERAVAAEPAAANANKEDRAVLDFFKGTTINGAFDGYYGYNFNQPIGRVNLLRAYDVSSNSFSLNQANLIFEHAPNVSAGTRLGVRLDFQYGQATETVQGSAPMSCARKCIDPFGRPTGHTCFPLGAD